MSLTSKFDPKFCKKVMKSYSKGYPDSKICFEHGISGNNLYKILSKYPELKEKAMANRKKNQKKRKRSIYDSIGTPVSEKVMDTKKMTDKEKIAHLESRLQNEKKRNKDLETLVKAVKEELGKS